MLYISLYTENFKKESVDFSSSYVQIHFAIGF